MKSQNDKTVPQPNKDIAPKSTAPARSRRVVSASQLKQNPPHTADDIRRLVREGRFAEMTPEQAGDGLTHDALHVGVCATKNE